MIVTGLSLTNFRSFESATFTFRSGVNLIAGVNGAGKSTILDAIRILLSRASRELLKNREATVEVGISDIRRSAAFTHLAIEFNMPAEAAKTIYQFDGQVNREDFVPGTNTGDVRDEGTVSEPTFGFVSTPSYLRAYSGQPLCIFFSPHRSILTHEVSKSSTKNVAFAQALNERRFNIRQVADWWKAQESLAVERTEIQSRLIALANAVQTFMPSIVNAQPRKVSEVADLDFWKLDPSLTRCNRFTGRDLSDGERGILAIVLEISRRLSLAYPRATDSNSESACVLIDEIELHLHPQWQRDVLGWLAGTFPNCQFIVTTHSPQVIGEFEPDRVWYVAPGEKPWQQERSIGLDSSRVIEELMGGRSRNANTEAKLRRIAELVNDDRLEAAKEELRALEVQLGENDPDVIRASGLIDFLEAPIDPD